jgi:hypothetical protein
MSHTALSCANTQKRTVGTVLNSTFCIFSGLTGLSHASSSECETLETEIHTIDVPFFTHDL